MSFNVPKANVNNNCVLSDVTPACLDACKLLHERHAEPHKQDAPRYTGGAEDIAPSERLRRLQGMDDLGHECGGGGVALASATDHIPSFCMSPPHDKPPRRLRQHWHARRDDDWRQHTEEYHQPPLPRRG